MRRRRTFDSGATPKDVRGARRATTLAEVDLEAVRTRMVATIERAKAEDPKELRRQLADREREIAKMRVSALSPRKDSPTAERVDRLPAARPGRGPARAVPGGRTVTVRPRARGSYGVTTEDLDAQFRVVLDHWSSLVPPPFHFDLGVMWALHTGGSYLYVMHDEVSNQVKIGRSTDPDRRLSGLQTSSPVPLEILVVVPEWVVTEADAHERWDGLRQRGEWFLASPELMTWVAGLTALEAAGRAKHERILRYLQARRERAESRGRPLERLSVGEARGLRERDRRSIAEERQRRQEAGCEVCGSQGPQISCCRAIERELWLCHGCKGWVFRIRERGFEQERGRLARAVEDAQRRLEEHERRYLTFLQIVKPR